MSIGLPDHSFARLAVAAETARDIISSPATLVDAEINGVPLADHLTEILDRGAPQPRGQMGTP